LDETVERLATFALSQSFEALPPEVVLECKRRVIDSLGIAMGGYSEEPCKIARLIALESTGKPGATVLGTNHLASPDLAVFANATMVHSQDYMDTYLSKEACHPSDNISAVLAAAEYAGAGGKAVILGTVLAYEVMCRLADAAGVRERGWDHVVYGVIASAVGVGSVFGLDARKMREALALAAVCNGALRQTRIGEVPMWKSCAPANASRNGFFAARLASLGMTGPVEAFKGAKGFETQISGPLHLDEFAGGGRPYMINQTYIKVWPVQYHTQAGIEAALALRDKVGGADAIEAITIHISAVGRDLCADTPAKWDPATRETADHSLPYIVVSALLDGEVTRATFDAERFRDASRLALVKRVEVRVDPGFSDAYPQLLSVKLDIATKGGGRFVKQIDLPKGHARNPLTDAEVEAKFRRLSEPRLGKARADAALQHLWQLEEVDDISEVLCLFAI
jgi:2-methylcitrate dehydratase